MSPTTALRLNKRVGLHYQSELAKESPVNRVYKCIFCPCKAPGCKDNGGDDELADNAMHNPHQRLEQLCKEQLSGVLYDADFISGLIFAVSACPEIPMPDTWLPWTIKEHGKLKSAEQADLLGEVLMAMMQKQLKDMRDDNLPWPAHFTYPDPEKADSTCSPVCRWLKGLLAGHQLLEPVWRGAWQKMSEKSVDTLPRKQRDLTHCLKMFSTFADIHGAIEDANRVGNHELIEKLPAIFQSLPEAMAKYVALSGELVSYLPDQFETFVSDPSPTN